MTIDKVHNDILFIADKSQGAFFTSEEIDNALDMAQRSWFMELYGSPRNYQPGRYISNINYGVSQKVNDSLTPFKKVASFVSDSTGVVTLPADYLHLLSINTVEVAGGVNYKRTVRIINEDELVNRLNSQICPPLTSEPIGILNSGKKIQLFPDTVTQTGKIYYLRLPVKPVYGYTQGGRTITYNSGTSTQLEWDDVNTNQIIVKALEFLGVNLKDGELVAFNSQKNATGV